MNLLKNFLSRPARSLAFVSVISLSALNYGASADPTTSSWIEEARVEASLQIADALLAGKISVDVAAKKMIAFEEGLTKRQERLEGVQKRIEEAVTSGDMTREEADAKYKAILNGKDKVSKGDQNGNARAQAYLKKVGTEIREAIANGEMTPEEGKAKYAAAEERIKQRMGGDKSKAMTKEDYEQGVAKMIEMVNAGEITREQMEARLNRMKKAMTGNDRANRDRAEISDDCMELRRRIGDAVRSGEMTREEAGKIWKDEGC